MKNITCTQSKQGRNALLIVSFCLLSGCSTLSLQHDDKSDICYTWRAQLRESEHYYAQSIAEGAAIGGLTGAGLGAMGALIAGGDIGTGALIGGITGMVAGGMGGYFAAKQKDSADEQALATSVRNDILRENGEIDRTGVAFAKLRDCRFAAADHIKAEFKAGRMPRDAAVKKLAELKRQFDEDIKMSQELGLKMGSRLTEFQNANTKILDKDPNARAMINAEKMRTAQQQIIYQPEPVEEELDVVTNAKSPSKKHSKTPKPRPPVSKKPVASPTPIVSTAPATKPPVAVEVAHVTETNQIKQKAFVDQVEQAKAQAKTAFSLEGSVSLLTPTVFLCER